MQVTRLLVPRCSLEDFANLEHGVSLAWLTPTLLQPLLDGSEEPAEPLPECPLVAEPAPLEGPPLAPPRAQLPAGRLRSKVCDLCLSTHKSELQEFLQAQLGDKTLPATAFRKAWRHLGVVRFRKLLACGAKELQ